VFGTPEHRPFPELVNVMVAFALQCTGRRIADSAMRRGPPSRRLRNWRRLQRRYGETAFACQRVRCVLAGEASLAVAHAKRERRLALAASANRMALEMTPNAVTPPGIGATFPRGLPRSRSTALSREEKHDDRSDAGEPVRISDHRKCREPRFDCRASLGGLLGRHRHCVPSRPASPAFAASKRRTGAPHAARSRR
jgi:hypothetical protein